MSHVMPGKKRAHVASKAPEPQQLARRGVTEGTSRGADVERLQEVCLAMPVATTQHDHGSIETQLHAFEIPKTGGCEPFDLHGKARTQVHSGPERDNEYC